MVVACDDSQILNFFDQYFVFPTLLDALNSQRGLLYQQKMTILLHHIVTSFIVVLVNKVSQLRLYSAELNNNIAVGKIWTVGEISSVSQHCTKQVHKSNSNSGRRLGMCVLGATLGTVHEIDYGTRIRNSS